MMPTLRPPEPPNFAFMHWHERKQAENEFKKRKEAWRREMDDWENQRKWDEAAMIVSVSIAAVSVVLFFVIGSYYAAGGIRGPIALIAVCLVFFLAVAEVKRRL